MGDPAHTDAVDLVSCDPDDARPRRRWQLVAAQPVLPHLGYILLVVATTVPAAAFMIGSTRLDGYPGGWRSATLVIAVLLVVTGSSVITMLLLPIWVGALTLVGGRDTPVTN